MKRNILIATVAAAALIGGGTATAVALGSDGEAPSEASSVRVQDDAGTGSEADDRDGSDSDGSDDDAREDAAEAKEDAAQAKAAKITAGDAIARALAHTSGTAVSAELDSDDGNLVWDVDVLGSGAKWTSVEIDPGTGKVLGSHTEEDDDGDAKAVREALKGSSTDAAEAVKAVGAKDREVVAVDLDDDGSARAWQVETVTRQGAPQEWNVSPASGKAAPAASDED